MFLIGIEERAHNGIPRCTHDGSLDASDADDMDYARKWRWHRSYSNFTGLSEGNKGVKCGRAAACSAGRQVEQEISCDATDRIALESAAERDEQKSPTIIVIL